MKPTSAILWLCLAAPCAAAQPAAPPAPQGGEPQVRRTTIEDDGSRIEELRIRGQVRSITVTPKVGPHTSYEIIPPDSGRDAAEGPSSARGASGQRVWRVFAF